MLLDVVALFRQRFDHRIVEPAHMELAEPSIATAVDRCVRQGATRIVVFPYFLAPGRHWDQDIPRLARAATPDHGGISILVTAPIGLHPLMAEIIEQRVQACLRHAADEGPGCQWCEGTDKCQWQANGD
jgi:sirohydrochlorin ferrochelatase